MEIIYIEFFVVKVDEENYLKGIHLSQATVSVLNSGTWKWVCIFKNQAVSHIVSKVGNGRNTSLIFDVWISGSNEPL